MKKSAKKTPNKTMPKGKGSSPVVKKGSAKAKVTGKKPAIKARKSSIAEKINKIKF